MPPVSVSRIPSLPVQLKHKLRLTLRRIVEAVPVKFCKLVSR
jgi:hypothetical protein